MNLQKLFDMQAKLDADITAKHPVQEGENRLEKKVLALLVELGECANEWRGFKFWSNSQKPRVHVGIPQSYWHEGILVVPVEPTKGQIYEYRNLLLEEYVDCLHFILSIGNDLKFDYEEFLDRRFTVDGNINQFFLYTNISVGEIIRYIGTDFARYSLYATLHRFLKLGRKLGFTDEQIEQAYYDKNKINFERQTNGY
ncbi:dUTP diphosphatase [Kurthia senegalensis]|uniref:dUTP diphosphatase n=1 Tax=Kurthia senegalensis TaxID=1033740 RepID=UPI0002886EB3|nr:dUTP diphosphatase [Kurthia senegalensis]